MKRFKQIDLLINIMLIGVFTIATVLRKDYTFIYGYLITGTWQVISMLVHTANGWFIPKKGIRIIYHHIVCIIISFAILTYFVPVFFYMYYFMLFLAPLMAISYTVMCYKELNKITKRHAFSLK